MRASHSRQQILTHDSKELTQPAFSRQGYYTPPTLANGVDFCMMDPSGSMGFKDHIKGYYSFWFKRGRPHAADPTGIVKLRYAFQSDKGRVEAGWFGQKLDMHTGRLLTRLSFYQLDLDVEAFLTDDHTLVEIFDFRKCTAREGAFRLEQTFPRVTYTFKPVRSLGAIPNAIRVSAEGRSAIFHYQQSCEDGKYRGIGITSVRAEGGGTHGGVRLAQRPIEPESVITVSKLRSGARIVRFTTLVDDMDSATWEADARKIHARNAACSVEDLRAAHIRKWEEYPTRSSFACSNPLIGEAFNTSIGVCRMGQHPRGSMATQLVVPCNHGMGTYWDAWFSGAGLLRTNHVAEARKLVDFWRSVYPRALRLARDRKLDGARFAWVLNEEGKELFYSPDGDLQIHNNVTPAVNVYEQAIYTGDWKLLAESYPMIQDSVRFVVDLALRQDSRGRWHLRELAGVDESGKHKRDELTTAATSRRGLRMLREASALTGIPVGPDLLAAEKGLDAVLKGLWTNKGVWRSYEGADGGGMATPSAFIHLPDARRFQPAINDAIRRCQEPHGLGGGDTSRMRCATFPWVEGQFAWAMALNGDPRGFRYLEGMTRYTNFFGGFAEYHWLHGEPSRDWFIAAHGVYLAALVDLCLQRKGDVVQLFPLGFRHMPWRSGAFRGFRASGGIVVDAEWNHRGKVAVVVRNDSPQAQAFTFRTGAPGAARMSLGPGDTIRWHGKAS